MDTTAKVEWPANGYVNTVNDTALTEQMLPSLARVTGPGKLKLIPASMAADDVAFFARAVPTLFYWVGITPPDQNAADAAPNHSPLWKVDERGLLPGLRSLLHAVVDYTGSGAA
jgi:metal-dependent amidase/aminoacylase/carboxypeptidase family protein